MKQIDLLVRLTLALLLIAILCLIGWAFSHSPILGKLARWFFFGGITISSILFVFSFVAIRLQKMKAERKTTRDDN
jgi:uncharacterized membrane protein